MQGDFWDLKMSDMPLVRFEGPTSETDRAFKRGREIYKEGKSRRQAYTSVGICSNEAAREAAQRGWDWQHRMDLSNKGEISLSERVLWTTIDRGPKAPRTKRRKRVK